MANDCLQFEHTLSDVIKLEQNFIPYLSFNFTSQTKIYCSLSSNRHWFSSTVDFYILHYLIQMFPVDCLTEQCLMIYYCYYHSHSKLAVVATYLLMIVMTKMQTRMYSHHWIMILNQLKHY